MTELEMEDLIASYPDEFFPGKGFELRGRQGSFVGVGRYDLLFEDRFKTKILMELKAVPAKYEVASQLAKYKDELRNRGEDNVLMWLVAPQVPHSVREFLDRIGIEYTEIHIAEFRRVADRHGVPNREAALAPEVLPPIKRVRGDAQLHRGRDRKDGINLRVREFLRPAIHRLWDHQQSWVTRDQLIDDIEKQAWATEKLDTDGVLVSEERRRRIGNWVDWLSANYDSGLYDLKGEFERVKVRGTWAYRPMTRQPNREA